MNKQPLFTPSFLSEEFGLMREEFEQNEFEQDEFEQDEFEQDSNEAFYEINDDECSDIPDNQNDNLLVQPNSPVMQLLKSNVTLSLNDSLIFENWEEVELFMDTYSEQHGFENKKVRTEKNKDGQLKKRRFDCEHSGKHKPKKTAIIENQRNTTSKKTECGFRVKNVMERVITRKHVLLNCNYLV